MEYIGMINVIAFLICFMLFLLGTIWTVGAIIKMLRLKCYEVKNNKQQIHKGKS